MATWVHKPMAFEQADAYRREADLERALVHVEKKRAKKADAKRREELQMIAEKTREDEERAIAHALALREARLQNHFTDRIRALLDVEGKEAP